jgi:pilus assembly protein Flp/PilA
MVRKTLAEFAHDDSGATAVEYGIVAAGIAVVIMGTISTLGDVVLTSLWRRIANAFPTPP